MKRIITGILAHVDAGKTTLSEGLLYTAGSIRKMGRVDNQDAFLDTDRMEKARGITIFSKQAELNYGETAITLLDTPGHVDFSAEMERVLQVLDYAVLVVSAADGVQGHTKTLWRLLERYGVPVFLFVNKMDQPGTDRELLMKQIRGQLSDSCIDFTEPEDADTAEEIAMGDEAVMEYYLENGTVETEQIRELIAARKIFPCYFGSALKMQGVEELLRGYDTYTMQPEYQKAFGAKVFKIARDDAGNRLTYLKVTGGSLPVKMLLSNQERKRAADPLWEEKVNQIRIYSGNRFELLKEAEAGTVCAVTGLTYTYPGQGFGVEAESDQPVLEPVLTYQIGLPENRDAALVLPKLKELEEEEPELHIIWNEHLQQIEAQIMGEVQIEILKGMIKERYGIDVTFGTGKIVYKETIADCVEGVGHFEPLRHYA